MYKIELDRWRVALARSGVTQRAIAGVLGWTERRLSDVVNGVRAVGLPELVAMATAVGCEAASLIRDIGADLFEADVLELVNDVNAIRTKAGYPAVNDASSLVARTVTALRECAKDARADAMDGVPQQNVADLMRRRFDRIMFRLHAELTTQLVAA